MADTVQVLVAFRVVQGIGAAAVVPASLALLMRAYPARRQGFAAGLFGALSSAAAAFGPVLGGVLVQKWDWQAIFWFNLPVGALGVVLALALIRRRPPAAAGARLDWAGVALSSAGLLCLTLAIIQGNEWGWLSAQILGLFAAAAVILAGFVFWELRISAPLFDLRHFRDRTWAAASAAIMTVDVAMMGAMFMLVIFMVAMMDYTELKAGLTIATLPVAALIVAPFAGRLVDRVGVRPPAVLGAVLAAAGLVAMGLLSRTAPLDQVIWRCVLVGAGIGLSLPALTAAGMGALGEGVKGAGAGMLNTARQLGFLLGVAILVAVFAHTMTAAVNDAADKGQAVTRAQSGRLPDRQGPDRRRPGHGPHHRRHRRHERDPQDRPPHRPGHRAAGRLRRGHRARPAQERAGDHLLGRRVGRVPLAVLRGGDGRGPGRRSRRLLAAAPPRARHGAGARALTGASRYRRRVSMPRHSDHAAFERQSLSAARAAPCVHARHARRQPWAGSASAAARTDVVRLSCVT